jgi:hypothetical protein
MIAQLILSLIVFAFGFAHAYFAAMSFEFEPNLADTLVTMPKTSAWYVVIAWIVIWTL